MFEHIDNDITRPSFFSVSQEENLNPSTKHLYDMLHVTKQEVWPGNPDGHS